MVSRWSLNWGFPLGVGAGGGEDLVPGIVSKLTLTRDKYSAL